MKHKLDCRSFSTKCVITVTNSRHRMTVSNSAEKACSKLLKPLHNCLKATRIRFSLRKKLECQYFIQRIFGSQNSTTDCASRKFFRRTKIGGKYGYRLQIGAVILTACYTYLVTATASGWLGRQIRRQQVRQWASSIQHRLLRSLHMIITAIIDFIIITMIYSLSIE